MTKIVPSKVVPKSSGNNTKEIKMSEDEMLEAMEEAYQEEQERIAIMEEAYHQAA